MYVHIYNKSKALCTTLVDFCYKHVILSNMFITEVG